MFRKIAFLLIRISLLPLIMRILFQRSKTTIIYYHDIKASIFGKHLQVINKKYCIISLQDYINGKYEEKKNKIIITFDDG